MSEKEKAFLDKVARLSPEAKARMEDKLDGFNMALDILNAERRGQEEKGGAHGGGADA